MTRKFEKIVNDSNVPILRCDVPFNSLAMGTSQLIAPYKTEYVSLL